MTITKERLLKIQHWRETYGADSNVMLPTEEAAELARIALASLTAEPVLYAAEETLAYDNMGEIHLTCLSEPMGDAVIPLYTAPPVPVVPEEIEPDSNNTYDYVDGWNACRAAMLQGAEPVSQTYELPELIEGMEVSIDVSTCDADAGIRYFGTVTEVSELDTAKNGYILLVQDAKPNFKTAGNSPAIPDDWVMVPKEPTQAMINAWLSEVANWRGHVAGYKAALAAAPQHEVK
ncbi:hypothetical protein [Salmonella enterica]|uniref:hypothetical protein n=1 Tax=Salmonella enterica TaxID=28901 RepID=UPI0009AF6F70|nr:hypothetical protein [Salmonella enterica]